MAEKIIESLLQSGALGAIAAALIFYIGKKIDRLHSSIERLTEKVAEHIIRSESVKRG
jgi:hypothetical protein